MKTKKSNNYSNSPVTFNPKEDAFYDKIEKEIDAKNKNLKNSKTYTLDQISAWMKHKEKLGWQYTCELIKTLDDQETGIYTYTKNAEKLKR